MHYPDLHIYSKKAKIIVKDGKSIFEVKLKSWHTNFKNYDYFSTNPLNDTFEISDEFWIQANIISLKKKYWDNKSYNDKIWIFIQKRDIKNHSVGGILEISCPSDADTDYIDYLPLDENIDLDLFKNVKAISNQSADTILVWYVSGLSTSVIL